MLELEKTTSRGLREVNSGCGSTSAANEARGSMRRVCVWYTKAMNSTDDTRDPVVTVRMPEELLEDLERLRPLLKQLPEYRSVKLTRSTLVRLVVAHGLERLRAVLKERVDDEMQVDLLEPRQHTLLGDD